MVIKFGKTLLMASLILLAGRSASADTIQSTLSVGNAGLSGYAGPYATLTIDLTSSTTATITFQTDPGFLMHGQNAAGVDINATSWSISNLTGTVPTGFSGPSLSTAPAGNEDGFGSFNQTFSEFDGYQYALLTLSFTVTDTSGTWANAASVLTKNGSGYDAAAAIGVCSTTPCTPSGSGGSFLTTGFAADPGGTFVPTPEPSSLLLLGSGILGAAGLFHKRMTGAH